MLRIAEGLAEAGFDDVRPAHTTVFQHIKAEGSRLSELAERAQITKQSMGYLVDYLEEHRYVERRADPSDRRASLIFLTEWGWAEVPRGTQDHRRDRAGVGPATGQAAPGATTRATHRTQRQRQPPRLACPTLKHDAS